VHDEDRHHLGVDGLRENCLVVAPSFTSRVAQPSDARSITDILQEGFATYRSWAPAGWEPPAFTLDALTGLAGMLGRDDVWCLIAVSEVEPIGHIALAPLTREEPAPAPAGSTYLWQLFVRPSCQGQGVATWLMEAALVEADRRGFRHLLLWTPRGAVQARRFYEREGWASTGREHNDSGFGLPTVEYGRDVPQLSSG
jgi:GNAT superfamily N-acetyltransferase